LQVVSPDEPVQSIRLGTWRGPETGDTNLAAMDGIAMFVVRPEGGFVLHLEGFRLEG
jgi:hypothetical protein